jgi:hypothetical protein
MRRGHPANTGATSRRPRPTYTPAVKEQRGAVKSMTATATVTLEDGSEITVPVSDLIQIDVGMSVLIVDVGDGAPIIRWGS